MNKYNSSMTVECKFDTHTTRRTFTLYALETMRPEYGLKLDKYLRTI